MSPRKPKILKSPAKGAKATEKQWRGAFRAVAAEEHLFDTMTKGRRAANAVIDMETHSKVRLLPKMKRKCGLCEIERRECKTWDARRATCTLPGCALHTNARLGKAEALRGDLTEYARPLNEQLSDYEVREGRDGKWGIYLRAYDVRIATFADNSSYARTVIARTFQAARATVPRFEQSPGWYTCGCGQWVHDKKAPCSVCNPIPATSQLRKASRGGSAFARRYRKTK